MKINGKRVVHAVLAYYALATFMPVGFGQSIAQSGSRPSISPAPGPALENRLFVELFDYAQLSKRTRLQVEQVTSNIFARAGVNLIWIDRSVGEKVQQGPESNIPPASAILEVRILPRIRWMKGMPSTAASGYMTGNMATVSVESARMASADYLVPASDLLGYTIAHELGHMLLGPQSHAVSGLMRARWDSEELQAAAQHALLFAPKEAAQIRAEIMAREGLPSAGAMAHATPPSKLGEKPPASPNTSPDAEIAQDHR